MPLHIVENDITTMHVDAIVNSTNHHMIGFSGVDRIIHDVGGEEFQDECDELRNVCVPGEAVYTNAYNLNCKYIIHTIAPWWNDGIEGDEAILRSCYKTSLELASELGCKSIAFPLMSAGTRGFPIAVALEDAVKPISEYMALNDDDMDIYLVLYGAVVTQIAETMFGDLDDFIAENYCGEEDDEEEAFCLSKSVCDVTPKKSIRSFEETCDDATIPVLEECDRILACSEVAVDETFSPRVKGMAEKPRLKKVASLDDLINQKHETFVEMLYRFMDEKGIEKPSQLYKRAGVSKATYSKLISGESKKPSLETAVGLAMALHLTYDEAVEFFASAGIALSMSSKFDIIVSYFLQTQNYNTWDMDVQLLKYGYKTIFSTL